MTFDEWWWKDNWRIACDSDDDAIARMAWDAALAQRTEVATIAERCEQAESIIAMLTADHNSGPNYVKGFEMAQRHFQDYPAPVSPQAPIAHSKSEFKRLVAQTRKTPVRLTCLKCGAGSFCDEADLLPPGRATWLQCPQCGYPVGAPQDVAEAAERIQKFIDGYARVTSSDHVLSMGSDLLLSDLRLLLGRPWRPSPSVEIRNE